MNVPENLVETLYAPPAMNAFYLFLARKLRLMKMIFRHCKERIKMRSNWNAWCNIASWRKGLVV